jgi:hypothetical protein
MPFLRCAFGKSLFYKLFLTRLFKGTELIGAEGAMLAARPAESEHSSAEINTDVSEPLTKI